MKRIRAFQVFTFTILLLISGTAHAINLHKIEHDNPGGNLGYRVDLDGNYLAASKRVDASRAGGIMIYNRNEGGENNWGEEDYVFSPHAAGAGDYFGESIDLYDDMLIVGRPGGSNDEKAFIFQRGGDGEWDLVRTLDPSEAPEIDETEDNDIAFGWSVAINDEWAVVGAPSDDSENSTQPIVGVGAGAIYTWRKVDGSWTFYDKWTAYLDDDAEPHDDLGWSVDVWGDNIVAGALYADIRDPDFPEEEIINDAGAVYLLYPSNGVWHLSAKLQAPWDEAHDADHFGYDVAMWGSRIIVGAPNHWGGGSAMMHFGAAFTYFRSMGINHEHTFYDPEPQQASHFGERVDVYCNSVLISNEFHRRDYSGETHSVGKAFHYGLCSDAHFHLLYDFNPENYVTEHGDNFSNDVAMDGSYYLCIASFMDDEGAAGAGAQYVYWLDSYYGEPGDGQEAEDADGDGSSNGGSTTTGSAFPSPYKDCVIINEYDADPTAPGKDIQEWVELLVIAEDGVDMRNWLLTDANPADLYDEVVMPGYNEAFIKFNDYVELSNIPGGTKIVIYDGDGPTNDVDPSDGDMFIYTQSEYLNRVAYSYYTIQLDDENDNITLWADDDGTWDIDNSMPIDHVSWGDPLIEPPDGVDWDEAISDSKATNGCEAYFSGGDGTINDDPNNWTISEDHTQGTLNTGQSYSGSGWQPDPTNHVTGFSATEDGYEEVDLIWTENDGAIAPDGYLIAVSTTSITDPVDGYEPPEDTDLSDGKGVVKIEHGNTSYSFTNCNPLTTYNFKIYPYTGSSSLINYKTDGTIPSDDATTTSDIFEPTPGDLLISEVCGDDVNIMTPDAFVEIINNTDEKINLENVQIKYHDNGSKATYTCDLAGTMESHECKVIANGMLNMTYPGIDANFTDGDFPFDGGTDIIEIYLNDSKAETIDQFNDLSEPWSWNADEVYERVNATSGASQDNWSNPAGTGSPGTQDPITLPVILSSFTAQYLDNIPTLSWTTQSEIDNMGWFIYRNQEEEFASAEKITDLIEGHGSSTEPITYVYEDIIDEPAGGEKYYYWLESIDYSGFVIQYDRMATLTIPDQQDPGNGMIPDPVVYGLYPCMPNPVTSSSFIAFNLPEVARTEIRIYNIKGELIRVLYKGISSSESIEWNGKDQNNKKLAAGIYLYQLRVNQKVVATRKLILLQ